MTSLHLSLLGSLCLSIAAIGCGSGTSDANPDNDAGANGVGGAEGTEANLFDSRYCEVLMVDVDGDTAVVSVFNTVGLNDCPPELWDVLDSDALAEERGSFAAVLNGPRFWTIDRATAGDAVTGEVDEFGGIAMSKVAELQLSVDRALQLQSSAAPYAELVVDRDNAWVFDAGREVYELVDPDGGTYMMQSYSHQVDDSLTSADLPSLGGRLELPTGWTFRARSLSAAFVLQATGQVTVTQDELRNTYQKY